MLDPGLADLLRRIENWPNVVAEPRYVAAAAASRPAAQITFHGDPPPVVPKVGDYGQLSSSLRAPNCRRTSLASSRRTPAVGGVRISASLLIATVQATMATSVAPLDTRPRSM